MPDRRDRIAETLRRRCPVTVKGERLALELADAALSALDSGDGAAPPPRGAAREGADVQVYQGWLCDNIWCSCSDLLVAEHLPPRCGACGGSMHPTSRYVKTFEPESAAPEPERSEGHKQESPSVRDVSGEGER